MKRYNLVGNPDLYIETEDPKGEWVKWSDIEKLRSKLIEEFSINVAEGRAAWIKKLFSSLS